MNNAIGVSSDRHRSNPEPPCIVIPGLFLRASLSLHPMYTEIPRKTPRISSF